MSQIVSPHDALHQTLRNRLQPDERLLWTDHPQVKKLRILVLAKWNVWDFLIRTIVVLLVIVCLDWPGSVDSYEKMYLWRDIFCGLSFIFMLFLGLVRTSKTAPPPYWRDTLYAITDQRAIIIVRLPACEPSVLSYLPGDIDPVPDLIRRDGSGILLFSEPREARIGRAGPTFELPGSFMGIAHVQEVAALLQQLKAKSQQPAQDSTEQLQSETPCA